MKLTVPPIQNDVAVRAAEIANAKMREIFLDESHDFYARKASMMSPGNMAILKSSWSPIRAVKQTDVTSMALVIAPQDAVLFGKSREEYPQIRQIVKEAVNSAMKENISSITETLLERLILPEGV